MIHTVSAIGRRMFLLSGLGLAARAASPGRERRRFATQECEIEMEVEFHDRHSSLGFRFLDQASGRGFCLSRDGDRDRDCVRQFSGALAIAHYHIRSRSRRRRVSALREYVRTIDHDPRFELRPPFEATLEFRQGVASDIQAFGYEGARPAPAVDPWYYFRQDLYLDARGEAFLVLHWKHSLDGIRMLDVIPGDGTRQVEA